MLETTVDAFVELAPHPVLASSIAECLAGRGLHAPIVGSMRRERPARETLLQACAALYAVGVTPQWQALFGGARAPVELPAYPWQRERYWLRARPLLDARSAPSSALLGARRTTPDGSVWYRAQYPADDLKWLGDHQVGGHEVMPAVALLEALRAAAQDVFGGRLVTVLDFLVHQPFLLDAGSGWTSLVSVEADGARLELWAGADDQRPEPNRDRLIASARATTAPSPDTPAPGGAESSPWDARHDELYARFAELGVAFGPAFRTLERWRVGESSAEAWLALPARDAADAADAADSGVSATLLDGALQLCLVAASAGQPSALFLPLAIASFIRCGACGARTSARSYPSAASAAR